MKYKVSFLVLLSTLIWTVVLAPAHLITRLLPVGAPLILQGITGSLWSGAVAQAALVDGDQILGQGRLGWRVRPMSLPGLMPCAEFTIDYHAPQAVSPETSAGTVAGLACASTGGTLALIDVAVDLPAGVFLRSPELRLGGKIVAQLVTLEWRSGSLMELQGHGLWTDAMILSDQQQLSLQTLPFDFRRDSGDSLVVQLDNHDLLAQQQDTPLHISLRSTVTLEGQFHAQAQLTTQPQTDDGVMDVLNALAEPQGAGVFVLQVRSQP